MGKSRIAATCAGGLFITMTALAAAAADKPPPPAFVWLVMVLAAASYTAFLGLRTRLRALAAGRKGNLLAAASSGAVTGMIAGAIILLTSSGEPSVTPTLADRAIFFAVVAVFGAICAIVTWLIAASIQTRSLRKNGPRTCSEDDAE